MKPLVVLPLPADIDAVTRRFWNQCGHNTYTLFFPQFNPFLATLSGIGLHTGSHHRPPYMSSSTSMPISQDKGGIQLIILSHYDHQCYLSLLRTDLFSGPLRKRTKVGWVLWLYLYFLAVRAYAKPGKFINVGLVGTIP